MSFVKIDKVILENTDLFRQKILVFFLVIIIFFRDYFNLSVTLIKPMYDTLFGFKNTTLKR